MGKRGSHLDSLGLTGTHLVSLSLTRSHLVSLGLTWSRLVSLGLTWSLLDSLETMLFAGVLRTSGTNGTGGTVSPKKKNRWRKIESNHTHGASEHIRTCTGGTREAPRAQFASLEFNLVSHGLTWSHLVSHGLTCSHLVSLGPPWSYMV